MKSKIVLYFASALILIGGAAVYFVSKENPKNNYSTVGEYNIWVEDENFTSLEESVSENITLTEYLTSRTDSLSIRPQFVYIDINTASYEDFMLLDGIGEKIAGNIIAYRNSVGRFNNIEEIMNVSGIGEKIFSNIKVHIYVENPVYYPETTEFSVIQPTEIQPDPGIIEETQEIPENEQEDVTENLETQAFAMRYDLNKITFEELMTLPKMDEETAQNIISLRTDIKYFSHPYELIYAEGMTEQYLSELLNYVYVEEETE